MSRENGVRRNKGKMDENITKTPEQGNMGAEEVRTGMPEQENMHTESQRKIYTGKNRRKATITGSTLAKITAFFLLVLSFVIGAGGVFAALYMTDMGVYNRNWISFAKEFFQPEITDVLNDIRNSSSTIEEAGEWLETYYSADTNLSYEIYDVEEQSILYSTYDGSETPYEYAYSRGYAVIFNEQEEVTTEEGEPDENVTEPEMAGDEAAEPESTEPEIIEEQKDGGTDGTANAGTTDLDTAAIGEKEFLFSFYLNPEFPVSDEFFERFEYARKIYNVRYVFPAAACSGILLFFICFIFLMCSAGHHNGREGITPSLINAVHLDVLIFVFIAISILGVRIAANVFFYSGFWGVVVGILCAGSIGVVWSTAFCMEFILRLKLGNWWKNTLIYVVCRWMVRMFRVLWHGFAAMIKGIPLVLNTVIAFLALCILEFSGILIFCEAEVFVLWLLEKMVLFPIVIYFSLVCRKLLKGSEALADGNLAYQIDTSRMILDFKEHGENLNCIAQGMTTAVEQRMKSEHLKTELITNVSHDLKTPLTSIINYADLIGSETSDNEKINEYAGVLLRQSRRMKKLLDDLVEASKATTGNLEVNLQRCEAGVLLTQAAGEYEQRFREKQLELITRQPETEVTIRADGRHLWRVFDNLLNNIFKYAQENSRVYLTVEQKGEKVEIIFRNMSKYPLDISADELLERFVRGDKSRHMEGNGLGLSIAKSLVDLQHGEMEIVTDGDLFKVILRFDVLRD